tara:strand:+ start:247 stop:543 length:297 start_codon:yes stop_codon:yes gene_type:complete
MIKWEKGILKALGLHHGAITAALIILASFVGISYEVSLVIPAIYLGQEYWHSRMRAGWTATQLPKGWLLLVKNIEVLDFVTPAVVSIGYNYLTIKDLM